MIAPVFLLTVLLVLEGPLGGDPPATGDFAVTFERIGERVLVARCAVGPNVTVIQTGDGLVVVDTHLSPGTMEVFRDAIEKESGRDDFRYVVNTHGHWDHSSGNQVFADATVVGHVSTPDFMAIHRIILSDLENRYRPAPPAAVPPRRICVTRSQHGAGPAVLEFSEADDKTRFGELEQDEFYQLGNRYMDEANAAAATAVFELTLELFPEEPMIWVRLGDACLAARDTLSAVSAFDRVSELGPGRLHSYAEFMLQALAGE